MTSILNSLMAGGCIEDIPAADDFCSGWVENEYWDLYDPEEEDRRKGREERLTILDL